MPYPSSTFTSPTIWKLHHHYLHFSTPARHTLSSHRTSSRTYYFPPTAAQTNPGLTSAHSAKTKLKRSSIVLLRWSSRSMVKLTSRNSSSIPAPPTDQRASKHLYWIIPQQQDPRHPGPLGNNSQGLCRHSIILTTNSSKRLQVSFHTTIWDTFTWSYHEVLIQRHHLPRRGR